MLDSHPDLAIPPETGFVPELIEACDDSQRPKRLVKVITEHRRWGDFGVTEDELLQRFRRIKPPDAGDIVRAFYEAYAEKEGKPRWGDKTPGYTVHMETIAGALPEARFVHIIRDGRDVALSRTKQLSLRPKTVPDVARRWRKRVREARRQGGRVPHYLEVRYERLVAEPEPVLREVCEFIELDFDPVMLSYHEHASERLSELRRDIPAWRTRPPRSAEKRLALHTRTAKPPDTQRIGRWREEMSADDVAGFEREAGDVLEELGYELAAPTS
jgi:hypothetical protein